MFPFGTMLGTGGTPAVVSVSPDAGVLAGGTSVTVVGLGFSTATDVLFGGVSVGAGNFTVLDDNHISAIAPAGSSAGFASVQVKAGALSSPNAMWFYYPTGMLRGFRADQLVTLGGANVHAWGDITGIGNNATTVNTVYPQFQASSVVNGQPAVFMSSAGGAGSTVRALIGSMVSAYTGTTLERMIIGRRTSIGGTVGDPTRFWADWDSTKANDDHFTTGYSLQENTGNTYTVRNSTLYPSGGVASAANTTSFVMSVRFTGSQTILRLNGTDLSTSSNSGSFSIDRFSMACGYSASANYAYPEAGFVICEDLLWDHALTSGERTAQQAKNLQRYALNYA